MKLITIVISVACTALVLGAAYYVGMNYINWLELRSSEFPRLILFVVLTIFMLLTVIRVIVGILRNQREERDQTNRNQTQQLKSNL